MVKTCVYIYIYIDRERERERERENNYTNPIFFVYYIHLCHKVDLQTVEYIITIGFTKLF